MTVLDEGTRRHVLPSSVALDLTCSMSFAPQLESQESALKDEKTEASESEKGKDDRGPRRSLNAAETHP
jgi:hypothetical protein